ncbi:MAG: diguanylate cyclase response regulator, partial [Desulfobacterales bacterium]|nr:diguanylate cyclase response regulator [Desulfobacterales bacterium]
MNDVKPEMFKILIVDDNPKNIQVLGNLLNREGYPTAFALGG